MPTMKIRHPLLIKVLGFAVAWIVRLCIGSLRYRFHAIGQSGLPSQPHLRGQYVYAFWHENMLLPAYHCRWPNIFVLISQHADGQFVAEVCHHLGIRLVRGSTTRGGTEALRQMMRLSLENHLVITPDGPRGPRRCVQPGIIYLAAKTGLPIIAMGVGHQSAWRLRSWDRFVLPKPWGRATLVTAAPIPIPPRLDSELLEQYRRLVEATLHEVNEAAQQWAEVGGPWKESRPKRTQTETLAAGYHKKSRNGRTSTSS